MNKQRPLPHVSFVKDFTTSRVEEWDVLKMYKDIPARFLEIGLLEGRTSRWFLEEILTHPASKLVGVDPFDAAGPIGQVDLQEDLRLIQHARRSCEALALATHKFQLHLEKSPAALRAFPAEYFDVVYVDGDHRAFSCLQDMAAAWQVLRPTGVLVLDDYAEWGYSTHFPRDNPRKAVQAFLSCNPPHKILWEGYTIGLQKLHDEGRPR